MNKVTDLHRRAMDLADQADAAARRGDEAAAQERIRSAFELEREAAEQIASQTNCEPARSVLLRSAASLALECHEYREAERLIATALAGNPPLELCEELRDLLETLYANSDLKRVAH